MHTAPACAELKIFPCLELLLPYTPTQIGVGQQHAFFGEGGRGDERDYAFGL